MQLSAVGLFQYMWPFSSHETELFYMLHEDDSAPSSITKLKDTRV